MRDNQVIKIDKFRGLHKDGSPLEVPLGFAYNALNVEYTKNSFRTRWGFETDTVYGGASSIIRIHNYQRSDSPVSPRYLFLRANGEVYDTVFSLVTPIVTVVGATDFSVISLYNRAYLTFHNRVRGVLNGKIYVWDPTVMTAARNAGGTAPATGPTATTGAAGNVAGGKHLISVVFETNTGFITKPGPATQYTAPGNAQINLTNIPTGTVGVVIKRHILVTPIILSYDGNPQHYEHFFVATISDNTTTVLTINFIDSSLVQSADYLYDQLDSIPMGVGFAIFQGCLLSFGENLDTSVTPNKEQGYVTRVSKSGQPESFSAVDGFVQVDPADGGGVKNACEFRGLLYAQKSARWYNIQPNDGPPNTWLCVQIDTGIGCECFGLASVGDDQGAQTEDTVFVASRSGIWAFTGIFGDRPLTDNIKDFYQESVIFTDFSASQLFVDPYKKRIYLSITENDPVSGAVSRLIVGNYEEGLNADAIKWSTWEVSSRPFTSIFLDVTNNLRFQLKFATGTTLYKQVDGATIDPTGDIPLVHELYLPKLNDYGISQYHGVYLSLNSVAAPSGIPPVSGPIVALFISATDGTSSVGFMMPAVAGRTERRALFNFVKDQARLRLANSTPSFVEVIRVLVTGLPYGEEYPQ